MSGEKEQLGCAYLFLDLRKEPCFRNPPKYSSTSPPCLLRPNFLLTSTLSLSRLNLHFLSAQSHKAEYPRSYVNPISSSWRIRLNGKVLSRTHSILTESSISKSIFTDSRRLSDGSNKVRYSEIPHLMTCSGKSISIGSGHASPLP